MHKPPVAHPRYTAETNFRFFINHNLWIIIHTMGNMIRVCIVFTKTPFNNKKMSIYFKYNKE